MSRVTSPEITPSSQMAPRPTPRLKAHSRHLRRALPSRRGHSLSRWSASSTRYFPSCSTLAASSSSAICFPTSGKPLIADIAFAVSTPIGITVAFLCYKHFVFRTKGNYLKEWLRCFAVYSVSFPMGLVILPTATHLFERVALTHPYAPFLAGLGELLRYRVLQLLRPQEVFLQALSVGCWRWSSAAAPSSRLETRMVRTIQLSLQARIQAILLAKYDIALAQLSG